LLSALVDKLIKERYRLQPNLKENQSFLLALASIEAKAIFFACNQRFLLCLI
jgi:hypothetical protein